MEKVRKIEELENDIVDQIKDLYTKAFPPLFGYKVEYFLGEEEGTHQSVLAYSVTSKILGNIYRKQMRIPPGQVYEEFEADFIGKVLTDYIMLGTSLIMNNIMAQRAAQQNDAEGILVKPFSEGRLNHINRN